MPLSNAKLLTRHASTKVLEKNYVKLIHPDAEAAMSALPSLIKPVEGPSDAERRALEVDVRPNEEASGDRAQHGIEPAPNGASGGSQNNRKDLLDKNLRIDDAAGYDACDPNPPQNKDLRNQHSVGVAHF